MDEAPARAGAHPGHRPRGIRSVPGQVPAARTTGTTGDSSPHTNPSELRTVPAAGCLDCPVRHSWLTRQLPSISEHGSLDAEAVEDLAGDLLDRDVRGIQAWNSGLPHQAVGLLQFPATLLEGGIAAAGATLFANLRQAQRIDRQAIQPIR